MPLVGEPAELERGVLRVDVVGRADRAAQLGELPRQRLDVVGADLAADLAFPVPECVHERRGPQHRELIDQCVVGERGREGLIDRVPERFQELRGCVRGRDAVVVNVAGAERVVREQADPQRAGVGADLLRVRARGCRRAHGVAGRAAVQHVEDPRGVAHAARHAQLDQKQVDDDAEVGHERRAAARRLQAHQTATTRGYANRAATVVRVPDRHDARGDRSRGTAARTAGRAVGVPRVVCWPVRERLGRRHETELRCVRAADAHEAGIEITLRERVGVVRAPARVAQELAAFVYGIALDGGEEVFQHERYAAERAAGQRTARPLPGLVVERVNDRVQLAVQLLRAGDRVVDQLEG